MRTTPDRSRTAEHGGGESREHRDRGERGSSAERFSKEGSPVHSSSRGASQEVSPPQPHHIPEGGKGWNYPGLDIMATGAFWQNYSGEFESIVMNFFKDSLRMTLISKQSLIILKSMTLQCYPVVSFCQ